MLGGSTEGPRSQNLSTCLLRNTNFLNVHELEMGSNWRLKFQIQVVHVRKEKGFAKETVCVSQASTYSYQEEFPESCTLEFYPTKARVDL